MSTHKTELNRRQYQRIIFDGTCELHQGDNTWPSRVIDISLRGALLERPSAWTADIDQPFETTIHLDNQGSAIVMSLELIHVGETQLGFHCRYIDLESAAHLKRLVELNLGDDELLNRELTALGKNLNDPH